jgi:hypothetical protein
LAPSSLLVVAFAVTGLLIVLSISFSYWVLSRQWVASMALATLASVWLLASVTKTHTFESSRILRGVITVIVVLLTLPVTILNLEGKVKELQTQEALVHNFPEDLIALRFDPISQRELWLSSGLLQTARLNIASGGPVWPVIACLYGKNCP